MEREINVMKEILQNIEMACKHCGKTHPDVITCSGKKKVLFLFDIANTLNWKDGLWAALQILEKEFDISYWNKAILAKFPADLEHFDFVLGWSSFDGEIAHLMRNLKVPHGLCIGGYMFEPHNINHFDVLFAESNWYADAELKPRHNNVRIAFGVNTDIFKPLGTEKLWDYTTIGAFSAWKRQLLLLKKEGNRFAVGQIQENNMDESFDIISQLLAYGVTIQGEVSPEILCQYINASKVIYLPATISGGSERSVWEAKACGIPVEIEIDNPKLQEFVDTNVKNHIQYAQALREGIESVI